MVNFGLNSASILGIFLAVAGAGLYFMRSIRPELSRDHDIFFAAVGLLCGLILLFQGWRLDPILQFGQFLLTASTIWFATETIRLRGVTTEQARRTGPIVEDRPVSNKYSFQAELEAIEPYEDEEYEQPRGRLRGTDYRSNRGAGYESEEPRVTRTRRSSDTSVSRETSRKRPRRPTNSSSYAAYDEWGQSQDNWEERPPSRPRRPSSDVQPPEVVNRPPRKRRPRPTDEDIASRGNYEATTTEYVDYQPVEQDNQDQSQWEQSSSGERSPKPDYDQGSNPSRFDY